MPVAQTVNIRITAGLQERQSAGHHEIGRQEGVVVAYPTRRDKGHRTDSKKDKTCHDAPFITVFLNEQSGGDSHTEVSQVVDERDQRGLAGSDAENLREAADHGCRHIAGNAPQGKTDGNQPPCGQL